MFFMQRDLQYFPSREVVSPLNVGLPQAQVVSLKTADGENLEGWHIPAQAGKPTILFFFGNGGRLYFYAQRFALLTKNGTGLMAISYRGYGASTGYPTEKGLIEDAVSANQYLLSQNIPQSSIVLYADSLGTGVAVALAEKHKFAGIVLDSAYSSTADIAAWRYPLIPVRLLMKDQFHSDSRIKNNYAPLLMLHGTEDTIVPIPFGRKLYELANEPKQFIEIKGAGHIAANNITVLHTVISFIKNLKLNP